MAPFLIGFGALLVFLLGGGRGAPRPQPGPFPFRGGSPPSSPFSEAPSSAFFVDGSSLSATMVPPARLLQVRLEGGYVIRYLATIEQIEDQSLRMQHDLAAFMRPRMLAAVPEFAYTVDGPDGRPVGSFVLRWRGDVRRWAIDQAQGQGGQPVSSTIADAIVEFYLRADPIARAEGMRSSSSTSGWAST